MRHRTMAEYALEQLREAIIMGELPAGTPLRLDELARSLGMSISPIREAVRQLEALGLAKHVPHQGARVLDFDVEELRDLFQIRLALESLAVRRSAERFTDATRDAARAQLDRFDAASALDDVRESMRAHTDFHFTLYEASQSQWLVALIRPAWDRSERFGRRCSRRTTARNSGTAPMTRRCSTRASSTTRTRPPPRCMATSSSRA